MATLYKVLKRDIKNAQSHYQLDVAENRLERGRENKTISTAQGRKLETFLSNKEMELDSGHHSNDDYEDGSCSSEDYSD